MRRGTSGVSVAVAALILAACTRTATIVEVVLPDGASQTLVVGVDTCNADPRVAVVEDGQSITLTVRADRHPFGSDDCADSVSVPLDEPLGDRHVLDGVTGDELGVVGRD